jgi:hypothetical protein
LGKGVTVFVSDPVTDFVAATFTGPCDPQPLAI